MAISTTNILNCLGFSPNKASIVGNLFGFTFVPKPLSLRRQLELMQGKHFHVNLILVGDFSWEEWRKTYYSIQTAREIYAKVDFGIGKLEWYGISASDAGSYTIIDNQSEAEGLTSDWTVPNNAHDLFVVIQMNGADGWSAVGGSCDKNVEGMTGSVVSLNGSDDNAGNTFAHEMGHYLGLGHIKDVGNFIGGNGGSNSWTGIYGWQGDEMKKHCWVHTGCTG
jgi:hypothetical protein